MPYMIAIDGKQALTRVWFGGEITGRDIIAATDELVAHPDYDPAFDQYWSLEAVTALDITPEEMGALVVHDRDLIDAGGMGHVKVAIVVTTKLRELVLRLYTYQMLTSGQDVRLFETEADAEAWLQEPRGE